MPRKSNEQCKRLNAPITLIHSEEDESVQNILLKSFALFLEQEANQRYNEGDGWLLTGGTICTQK